MNPQGEYYHGGASYGNRSPGSARQGYTPGAGMAMGGGRRNPSQLDPVAQSAMYADDRFNSFDNTSRFDRGTPTQGSIPPLAANGFGAFGTNQSSWIYNGSAATVSGPPHDGSRMRGVGRRAPLLPEWTTTLSDAASAAPGVPHFYTPQQHLASQQLAMANAGAVDPFGLPPQPHLQYPQHESRQYSEQKDMGDLIPTAIVIKNIPFNIRRETLQEEMIRQNLPIPYAFNYHFDQGVFRGLAFANFSNAHDTALVIDRMNGMDVGGRKLRVEYKKMLPEHERERIEREKREKRGQLEEQHRSPSHQVSISSLHAAQRQAANPLPLSHLDMNDPTTLRYYMDLHMFCQDDSRETMIFPPDTSPEDRRIIHTLSQKLELQHTSRGEGKNRQLHVTKAKQLMTAIHMQAPNAVGLDSHPRGLSRAATFDLSHTTLHSHHRGMNLAVPGSPDGHHGMNSLRGVKSFADLRSFSPSPSDSVQSNNLVGPGGGVNGSGAAFMSHYIGDNAFGSSLTVPSTAVAGMNTSAPLDPSTLVSGLHSLSLGPSMHDMSGTSHAARAREVTPGAIGSQRPGANGTGRANPERQPRGPGASEWDAPTGFGATRGRVNGHMTRGSDSSENAARITPASGPSGLY